MEGEQVEEDVADVLTCIVHFGRVCILVEHFCHLGDICHIVHRASQILIGRLSHVNRYHLETATNFWIKDVLL